MTYKRTLVLDFDGVLHSSPEDDGHGDYNFDLIRQGHALGYPVAISTCAGIAGVARRLDDAGFTAYADFDRRIGQNGWRGGDDGKVVLVTNMKVHGWIVDDNGFNYQYGDPECELWDRIAKAELARDRAARRRSTTITKVS